MSASAGEFTHDLSRMQAAMRALWPRAWATGFCPGGICVRRRTCVSVIARRVLARGVILGQKIAERLAFLHVHDVMTQSHMFAALYLRSAQGIPEDNLR